MISRLITRLSAGALLGVVLFGCAAPTQPSGAPLPLPSTSPTQSASAPAVTGNLTYVEDVTLPNVAVAEINLVDITVEAGEPQVIASQSVNVGGKQSPIPFSVAYAADKINQGHTYGIAVRIMEGQETLFTTTQPKKVITQGNPITGVDIVLAPAGPEATSGN